MEAIVTDDAAGEAADWAAAAKGAADGASVDGVVADGYAIGVGASCGRGRRRRGSAWKSKELGGR